MIYNEAINISKEILLPIIIKLYGLEQYEITPVKPHEGGRNLIYDCQSEITNDKIIRVSFLDDRDRDDFLSEVEYIRYLAENGASVSDVVTSKHGNLLEEISYDNHNFFICVFERAKGKLLVDNNYKYREGVPLTEYFYNCGKVLGKMHQLSKLYNPIHKRYEFFDKYNAKYFDELIPDSLTTFNSLVPLKTRFSELLNELKKLDMSVDNYGMVHFDYSDGNYMIDFDNGQITVFDFDNSRNCWYMYDLANVWTHGVGWIQFERDVEKRREFMDAYFKTVIEGYRSETDIEDSMLEKLPLFINITTMEYIIDEFEIAKNNGEELECDEEMEFYIKCLLDDIPYEGFFLDNTSADIEA